MFEDIPGRTHRVCAFSLKGEDELEEGASSSLRRCSRCKETYYSSRQAQEDHWETHRKVCCAIEDDDVRTVEQQGPFGRISYARDGFQRFGVLVDTLHWLLEKPMKRIKGRLFLYCILGIRRILHETDEFPEWSTTPKMVIESLILESFWKLHEDPDRREQVLARIWAIPGLASFFMSDAILCSNTMWESKLQEKSLGNSQVYVDKVLQPLNMVGPHPEYMLPASYCYLITEFLAVSCLESKFDKYQIPGVQPNGRAWAIQMHALMHLWLCPYTRRSIPHTLVGDPRHEIYSRNFFVDSMFWTYWNDEERFPLEEDVMMELMIKDEFFFMDQDANGKSRGIAILDQVYETRYDNNWRDMNIFKRWVMLNKIIENQESMLLPENASEEVFKDVTTKIMGLAFDTARTSTLLDLCDSSFLALETEVVNVEERTVGFVRSVAAHLIVPVNIAIEELLNQLEPKLRAEGMPVSANDIPSRVQYLIALYALRSQWEFDLCDFSFLNE